MRSRLHSHSHVNELCYQAIRKALGVCLPVSRDRVGRFISRKETVARQLRSELAAQNNRELAEALDRLPLREKA